MARSMVRNQSRNGGDSTMYTDERIDQVIQLLSLAISHDLKLPKIISNISFVASTMSVDISSLVASGFEPHHALSAYITTTTTAKSVLQIVAAEDVYAMNNLDSNEGPPQYIAFETPSSCICYPVPDQAYTGKLRWFSQFDLWTPGDAGASSNTIDLPNEVLFPMLNVGCPAALQFNEPEHGYAIRQQEWYQVLKRDMSGIGYLGARVSFRTPRD